MIEPNSSSEIEQPQVTNLSQVNVGVLKAELVRMHQSAAEEIQAEDMELDQSAAANVTAGNLTTRLSAIALVQAEEVTINHSAAAAVRADTISINGSAAVVVAGNVDFGDAYVGMVAAREVHGEKIDTFILLSPKVEGNVTTMLDTRGALIAGLVGGMFAGLTLLLGRRLFGRK